MSFNELGLSAELLRAVGEQGYTDPTPIQRQSIPVILQGGDVMAAAQTGTGKTAGFTLPLLQRLNTGTKPPKGTIRALVLTPTRELAAQVEESVRLYGRHLPLRSVAIFGGVNINPQIKALRSGVDILVATPGRLLDHVQQKTIDLSKIEILVLDEADRMLDMGFAPEVRRILGLLPKVRQNLLFSATFSFEIRKLAEGILRDPVLVEVGARNTSAELVAQVVHPVDQRQKRGLLSYLISSNNWQQVLVFIRTKHSADRLARQLQEDGLKTVAIHGNKSQGARTRALADFKANKVRVLVATDIAARGLDIDQLPHVVNYDLPNVPEDYVHRIGRTGRAGNEGRAISLVSPDEFKQLRDIERLIKRELPQETIWEHVAASWGYGQPDVVKVSTQADEASDGRQSRRDTRRRPHGERRDSGRGNQARNGGGRRQHSQAPREERSQHARGEEKRPRQHDARPHAEARHAQRQERPANSGRQQQAAPQSEVGLLGRNSGRRNKPRRGRNAAIKKEVPALLG
ncbi:MAG TPA: DEAD/DEAH box helicase [Gammaproteobacteria bacterium]|nr:DEAD/DEAH box helicase [Gammaproteobacteria bacterium]